METKELLQRLDALLPAVRERRAEIEKARRLPRDLADDLRRTGVFSLGVPWALGGQEAVPVDILRTIETVSQADGSTGWCVMVGISNNQVAGFMSEEGAKEVFADPNAPTAGIAAPAGAAMRVPGGVRISGRWSFGSGVTHCDWLWAGCTVMDDRKPRMTSTGPEVIHVCVPISEVEIHDNWHVSGLNGTGSSDVSVRDSFVPEQRIFSLFDNTQHRSDPLYQLPPLGWFVSQVVAVSLGIARVALDELAELAQTKVPTLSAAALADKSVAQVDVARAEASLSAARAYLYDTVEDLWQTAMAGRELTPKQRAQNRIAAINAAEVGAAVTRTAHLLAGGSSIYSSSPLQRHMRDAEAITHHFTVAPHLWEDAGRIFLGREASTPMF